MIDMKVEKLKRKIRKMDYWQRYELMHWLNLWYAAEKNQEE
tara:strand:- start:1530 stop:1652 length:123 start_codon:yes stop_codon:yes gene_type:complete